MRNVTILLSVLLLGFSLVLSGCEGGGGESGGMTEEQWKAMILPWMTEAEVIALVGRPPDNHTAPPGLLPGVSGQTDCWTYGNEQGYVVLNDGGKVFVIGWGSEW